MDLWEPFAVYSPCCRCPTQCDVWRRENTPLKNPKKEILFKVWNRVQRIQRVANKIGDYAKTENQPSPASPITVVLPEASSNISLQKNRWSTNPEARVMLGSSCKGTITNQTLFASSPNICGISNSIKKRKITSPPDISGTRPWVSDKGSSWWRKIRPRWQQAAAIQLQFWCHQ